MVPYLYGLQSPSVCIRHSPPAMPGWPVRVFISLARQRLPRDAVLLACFGAGQAKAADRGHVVTKIVCFSMVARERRRRACRGCCPRRKY